MREDGIKIQRGEGVKNREREEAGRCSLTEVEQGGREGERKQTQIDELLVNTQCKGCEHGIM